MSVRIRPVDPTELERLLGAVDRLPPALAKRLLWSALVRAYGNDTSAGERPSACAMRLWTDATGAAAEVIEAARGG